MLLWKAIQAAKLAGMEVLDLGRSDLENPGLIKFKERWGAQGAPLVQWRAPVGVVSSSSERRKARLSKIIRACVPRKMLVSVGRLMYRHVG